MGVAARTLQSATTQMNKSRRRRSDIFRTVVLVFAVSTCKQVDSCGKACDSCQSSADRAADNASSCDCGATPGGGNYYDDGDGWWYGDDDGSGNGTPNPTCQFPQVSCDSTQACEANLTNKDTCGHCDRDCGLDECVDEGDYLYCRETVHENSESVEILEVAADDTFRAWRTETTTIFRSEPLQMSVDLLAPLTDLAVLEGSLYGITATGDVVRYVFPEVTPQILAAGPSDAHMMELQGAHAYWLQAGAIVRVDRDGGTVETMVPPSDLEIVDFLVDAGAIWVAGYREDMPTYVWFAKGNAAEQPIEGVDSTELAEPLAIAGTGVELYIAEGERLFVLDKSDFTAGAFEVGAVPPGLDEMEFREPWIYVRSGSRLVALTEQSPLLTYYEGLDPITSMSLADDRVFFTTSGALMSVAW